ncbi:hypothetical protein GLOIN_2v1766437 [Rhizophagus irregularis DAOM 181602=DAOM 197198]|uniref:HAT C-terminal dimerisation domain-containing protein n=1 Tax=Rhizophagus irregularis (strain DAOM 181602 / DAOM 197198 / MUCL 43194) TaxID=747089 RepID=A0A2P4QLM5_RHIID|nr:hypothetical protein GLOIN_2v1766437 [Rhizophagus irregularis DAOM 181602=DAOM 197198]POG78549.1 hypothetical protein GLOIN_2v1766437 [Rhizophagus irregularis DAOM 181602=DAOM 197198]|eukprot:XP_025185415.1 hypothetical protein GLOIN_2v1766437 [Rhizophagus irregularis DAOM 181602=DAOM 197198]
MRWIAHHIQLISSDICNHPLAKKVLSDCQKIISFFKNSYPAGAALREEIFHTFTVGGNLKTSTKTRWSTAWDCCESLLRNENNIRSVKQLRNLIAPVKKAVKDVEFQNTILADVFVELVKIAIAVQEIPTPLNNQFPYFLHPTYRGDNLTHNTYKKIILRKALEIWKQTGGGEKTLKLHSITPHNASTERVFSVLNWYLCKRRNKMNISHLESLAQIHSFLIANAPGELNFINNNISQDEFTAAFNQIAVAMEEGIDLFEENDSFPVFDDDSEEDNDLLLQNENGLNLEISELIQLNVNQSGSINENQADINESRIEHGNKDFNIEDLLHDD